MEHVVAGALISGTLAVEDEVELCPTATRARIRGLQYTKPLSMELALVERTTANLAGIDSSDARRGIVLAPPRFPRHPNNRISLLRYLPQRMR